MITRLCQIEESISINSNHVIKLQADYHVKVTYCTALQSKTLVTQPVRKAHMLLLHYSTLLNLDHSALAPIVELSNRDMSFPFLSIPMDPLNSNITSPCKLHSHNQQYKGSLLQPQKRERTNHPRNSPSLTYWSNCRFSCDTVSVLY